MQSPSENPVGATSPNARWPERLVLLCLQLRAGPGPQLGPIRAESWLLVNMVLLRYLRLTAGRLGGVDEADLQDIAAEKSLDLLRNAESGAWDPGTATGLPGFLSTVARNGLIDHLRKAGRLMRLDDTVAGNGGLATPQPAQAEDPARIAERREFSRALRDCAEHLKPRSRRIWLYRVFFELTSKEIAAHPEIGLQPGHVDVILQRCRETVVQCMARKGFSSADLRPGTYADLCGEFLPIDGKESRS